MALLCGLWRMISGGNISQFGAVYPGGVQGSPQTPLLNPSTTHKIKNALNGAKTSRFYAQRSH